MGRKIAGYDGMIIIPVLFLAGFSLAIIWSTNPTLFGQQLIFFLIGAFLFFLVSQVEPDFLRPLAPFLYCLSLFFIFVSFFFPSVRGAHRWITILGTRFQPSELIKPFFIASLASFLSAYPPKNVKLLLVNSLLLIPALFLIFHQPDLGNAIILLGLWMGMMVVAGLRPHLFLLSTFYFLLSIIPLWHFLKDYQKARVIAFLNPGFDPAGAGYNAIQAIIAVGSGGLFGQGLGRGTQSHLRFLPEAHTDFVFASLAEEFGLFGCFLLLLSYFILLWRILTFTKNCRNSFLSIFSIGIFSQIFLQVFINIGMDLGLIPITGITLPLVSYGGSSIISTMISLGFIQAVERKKLYAGDI